MSITRWFNGPIFVLIVAVLATPLAAQASLIPRSEDALPLAELVRERLMSEDVDPSELLAGAQAQFDFFFPSGVSTQVGNRTQLDALVATIVLLEEGIRRGAATFENAKTLFEAYGILFLMGRSGSLQRQFEQLRDSGGFEGAEIATEALDIYLGTLEACEQHGLESAQTIGELLITIRPDDSEVAYVLSSIAEQAGDFEEAARLYEMGLLSEHYAERLFAYAELHAVLNDGDFGDTLDDAVLLAPALDDSIESMDERVDQLQRLYELHDEVDRDRASDDERFEFAQLARQAGWIGESLTIFESLEDWSSAPDEFAEEYAIAAMEANLPLLMRDLMAETREDDNPSSRLLQLRIVSESVGIVGAAAAAPEGLRLETYLSTEDGQRLSDDLAAFDDLNSDRAQFVRVYLELVTALIHMRRAGSIDEDWANEIQEEIETLVDEQPDNASAYRFWLMLALYERDLDQINEALDAYREHCDEFDCAVEYRRIASMMLIYVAVSEATLDPLDNVQELLEQWPSDEQGPLFFLVRGTIALVEARLGRGSDSERESLTEQAEDDFRAGVLFQGTPGQNTHATAADYAALYNNLAYLSLDDRDPGVARLYLGAARRYLNNHPNILLNLGVSMAQSQSFSDALVTFGLGAMESLNDPGTTFQLIRWTGHLYDFNDRPDEAQQAYEQALMLYETRGNWTDTADDGVFAGGPIEWGLRYVEDEGLVVTLDLTSPPMFFVPAPISILEMSAEIE